MEIHENAVTEIATILFRTQYIKAVLLKMNHPVAKRIIMDNQNHPNKGVPWSTQDFTFSYALIKGV